LTSIKPIPNPRAKKRNPEAVQENILRVATEEFAAQGYAGARINVIAERTSTSKRMIYYYFSDKETLYRKVLEAAYRGIRHGELSLGLDDMSPVEAMSELVRYTFEHELKSPHFVRLVMNENIQDGRNLEDPSTFRELNAPATLRVASIYNRGVEQGDFRSGLSPVELHWYISGLCFFNMSNRATFGTAFGNELFTERGQERLCEHIIEMIIRFLRP